MLREAYGATARGSKSAVKAVSFPVPLKGVNAISAFSGLAPDECHYTYNLMPTEQGLTIRDGTKEWTNSLSGDVRTIIPYNGKNPTGSSDKLFATDGTGIWDVTSSGAGNASKVHSFSTTGSAAGWGVWIYWATASGDDFILYADSANGLIEYNVGTDTWTAVTGVTGLDETKVRFVAHHKLRIWLILEDDPNAYYLGVDSKSGTATEFELGSKFPRGGDCAGIFNFTQDTGSGLDDYFIAISRSGDILVYEGGDPSSATTWSLVGRWRVGAVPVGRRFAAEVEGDVLVLSSLGISSLRELLMGLEGFQNLERPYGRLALPIRERMKDELSTQGWEIHPYPSIGSVVIQSPERRSEIDRWLHYVFNLNTRAWGYWRGVKSVCMDTWKEEMYYGDDDGSIWYMTGTVDDSTLADSTGDPIDFSLLTAYSDLELPGIYKRGAVVKPVFFGEDLVYTAKVLYDYDFVEILAGEDTTVTNDSVWDTGEWDSAIWVGKKTFRSPISSLDNAPGIVLGVAIRGNASKKVTLMDMNVAFTPGGFL